MKRMTPRFRLEMGCVLPGEKDGFEWCPHDETDFNTNMKKIQKKESGSWHYFPLLVDGQANHLLTGTADVMT